MTRTFDRAAYIQGLRAIADLLEANPALPPFHGGEWTDQLWFVAGHGDTDDVARERLGILARAMGAARKEYHDDSPFHGFALVGSIHGFRVDVRAPREAVCTKVVIGTREVQRERVVAPAVIQTPAVVEIVTETVEDFEWVCDGSILGASS